MKQRRLCWVKEQEPQSWCVPVLYIYLKMNAGGLLPATMLCNINLWLVVLVINTWDCAEFALKGKLSNYHFL
jgi:hypothetical protein